MLRKKLNERDWKRRREQEKWEEEEKKEKVRRKWSKKREIRRIASWEKLNKERICFYCGEFGYIAHYYRNKGKGEGRIGQGGSEQPSSDRFKVLTNQIIRIGISNVREPKKNRKIILKEVKKDERKQGRGQRI